MLKGKRMELVLHCEIVMCCGNDLLLQCASCCVVWFGCVWCFLPCGTPSVRRWPELLGHGSSAPAVRMFLERFTSYNTTNVGLCWPIITQCLIYALLWLWVTIVACPMVSNGFHSTRLETRTKESNTCTNSWVVKLVGAMKVIIETLASIADRFIRRGLSISTIVRTRKMVNYACEGWSLGKLRWRLAALLTCKSFVTHWYRGERLIEPSSSWFLPKFPSG